MQHSERLPPPRPPCNVDLSICLALLTALLVIGWAANANAELTVGDQPRFQLENLDGDTVALADYRANVVLVDIWATWCAPCQRSMPFYRQLYEKHADDGFVVLAVSVDEDRDAVAEFRRKHELPFPVLLDDERDTAAEFSPPTMPTAYLIDTDGVVRHRHVGFSDDDREKIEQKVNELLDDSDTE